MLALTTSFSFEKNISSLTQLNGFYRNIFVSPEDQYCFRKMLENLNLTCVDQWDSQLSALTTVQTADCRVVGALWRADWEMRRSLGEGEGGPPPPSHNQLLILSGGSEWLSITTHLATLATDITYSTITASSPIQQGLTSVLNSEKTEPGFILELSLWSWWRKEESRTGYFNQ